MNEWETYKRTVDYLTNIGAIIVCACPPVGTDSRFKKCMFPKPPRHPGDKGPRDEVDFMAIFEGSLILIEAKPRLSWCLQKFNVGGESDVDKLRRISALERKPFLAKLSTGFGQDLTKLEVICCLSFEEMDDEVPEGFLGIHTKEDDKTIGYGLPSWP